MTDKARAIACAKALGATIGENDPMFPMVMDVEAVAPDGFQWKGCDCHVLVATAMYKESKAAAWADLIDRMKDGLVACPPDCDCRDT